VRSPRSSPVLKLPVSILVTIQAAAGDYEDQHVYTSAREALEIVAARSVILMPPHDRGASITSTSAASHGSWS
jgi:hypothetical protein